MCVVILIEWTFFRPSLTLRKQFGSTQGASGIKSANKVEENKNKKGVFLTETQKNKEGKNLLGWRAPNRSENVVSTTNKESKSLYEWYQYLKKSGRFRFGA